MATLAEKVKAAGLKSAADLTRATGTSKETLTNWMNHKPLLFDVVLKGALATKAHAEPEVIVETKNDLGEPEQTWAFSHEDLQEQARLIERLTAENSKLAAELQLSKRNKKAKQ